MAEMTVEMKDEYVSKLVKGNPCQSILLTKKRVLRGNQREGPFLPVLHAPRRYTLSEILPVELFKTAGCRNAIRDSTQRRRKGGIGQRLPQLDPLPLSFESYFFPGANPGYLASIAQQVTSTGIASCRKPLNSKREPNDGRLGSSHRKQGKLPALQGVCNLQHADDRRPPPLPTAPQSPISDIAFPWCHLR